MLATLIDTRIYRQREREREREKDGDDNKSFDAIASC